MPRAKVAKDAKVAAPFAPLADFARDPSDRTQALIEAIKRGIVQID